MASNQTRLVVRLVSCTLLMSLSVAEAADPTVKTARLVTPPTEPEPSGQLGAGDWLVRSRVAGLLPIDETSSVGLIGGRIETPNMVIPDAELVYFATDHISVSGQVGALRTRPQIVGSMVGTFDIGDIWSAAVAVGVQYHFAPEARFNPYAGIGASYSHPISADPAEGVADFDVLSQTNLMLQIGADYHIAGDWFGNAEAKYLVVPEQVYEGGGARFTDDLDMVVVGVGIGYRF